MFPLETLVNGDSAIVSRSMNGVDVGSRIVSINGHQMPEIIQRIKSTIPSDGYNTTYKEYRIRKEFDRFFRAHFNNGDTFKITVQNPDGRVSDVILPVVHTTDSQPALNHPSRFTIIDSLQTALLTIPTFTEDGFTGFLEQVFAQLDKQKIKKLIIDIRNNEGGRDEDGLTLFSYLVHEPFEYYKKITVHTADTTFLSRISFGEIPFNTALPDYSRHVVDNSFLPHSNLGLHQPRPNAFSGRVYVLINGGTFSTASEFASIAHAKGRAVFIGTETGGGYYGNCSLGTPTLTLPNSKLRLSIPLGKYELAVPNTSPSGRGLIPDVPITEYTTDLLRNKDKALAYSLEIIGRNDD
jgi:C-terminal processing protease CtpA/Prc